MKYTNVTHGYFISRPNRFVAYVEINGKAEICHVKNTGRCKELLIKGALVFLQISGNPHRKTKYDVIAVVKNGRYINMDSQIPNKVFEEWLYNMDNVTYVKPECVFLNSRFDFYFERNGEKCFAEVKGVTLEKDNVASFPDAPTLRGIKHLNELVVAQSQGYKAYVVFIIQMEGVKLFTPNYETHPQFAQALKTAEKNGVEIICLDCHVTKDSITANNHIDYIL